MKKLLIAICFITASFMSMAQDYKGISDAFRGGNASALAAYFQTNLEYSDGGRSEELERSEVERRIKRFFQDHEPTDFDIVHKGVSASDVHYCIAELKANSGDFRITLYLHPSEKTYRIKSIEIESE